MPRLVAFVVGLILACVGFGLLVGLAGYVGIWCCYVDAVVQFINQLKTNDTDAMVILFCLAKWFILGPLSLAVGFWAGVALIAGGLALAIKGAD